METHAKYTNTPSYLEAVQSQLPALQLLINMGWDYLSPEECVSLRGGRLGSALLEPVLLDHIRSKCRFEFKGRMHAFSENAIQSAVQELSDESKADMIPSAARHSIEQEFENVQNH